MTYSSTGVQALVSICKSPRSLKTRQSHAQCASEGAPLHAALRVLVFAPVLAGTLGWLLPCSHSSLVGTGAAERAAELEEALADAQKLIKDQVGALQLPSALPQPRQ